MKRLLLTTRGKRTTWGFEFLGDPANLAEWRADGLEVDEVCNTVPLWVPASLLRVWCFAQDCLNFNWGRG